MAERICPRSPRETMAGWSYLPRFIDKIRLHLAGKLHTDYQENFCKAMDKLWLESAGVDAQTMIDLAKSSVSDGEICDWVRTNVRKSPADKAAHHDLLMERGKESAEARARLAMRKEQSGISNRSDIMCFVDYIDADEGRI